MPRRSCSGCPGRPRCCRWRGQRRRCAQRARPRVAAVRRLVHADAGRRVAGGVRLARADPGVSPAGRSDRAVIELPPGSRSSRRRTPSSAARSARSWSARRRRLRQPPTAGTGRACRSGRSRGRSSGRPRRTRSGRSRRSCGARWRDRAPRSGRRRSTGPSVPCRCRTCPSSPPLPISRPQVRPAGCRMRDRRARRTAAPRTSRGPRWALRRSPGWTGGAARGRWGTPGHPQPLRSPTSR